jgi:death-on-curing protein
VKYLLAEQVLFIHARIIDESGGAHGVRDLGLLKSAVGRPQATFDNRDLYPDVYHKAAALMDSLINNHPFIDGNKRTSIASTALFLRRNGFRLEGTQQDIETFTLDMALKKISIEVATNWLKLHATRWEA